MPERQVPIPYYPRLVIILEVAAISAAGGVLGAHVMFEVLNIPELQAIADLNQIRPLVEALAGGFAGLAGFGLGFDVDKFLQRSRPRL